MSVDVAASLTTRIQEEGAFLQDVIREVERVLVGQRSLLDSLLIGLLATGKNYRSHFVQHCHGYNVLVRLNRQPDATLRRIGHYIT